MPQQTDILVVDGYPSTAWTIAAVLEVSIEPRPKVSTALDGLDALEAIRQSMPHVVLMDLELAGLFAYALARMLRRSAPETRIIAMTAHGGRFASAARSPLFDETLTKPIELLDLRKAVGTLTSATGLVG